MVATILNLIQKLCSPLVIATIHYTFEGINKADSKRLLLKAFVLFLLLLMLLLLVRRICIVEHGRVICDLSYVELLYLNAVCLVAGSDYSIGSRLLN